MPPEMNDIHAKLGEHGAAIAGHRRELDGLWDKDTETAKKLDDVNESLVKVRIQVAIIMVVGMGFVVLVQAVTAKFVIEAIGKMMGGH